ncbi:uncharacterized protein LOC122041507 [Zingiber officinale]|uniref:uncharacterized protein LOC122041507 n=1 Tax=Zingiber officinale TaxID=94328 RepID=UPI001C4B740B|nr:uncharacterized protein LOC122041507 [Zingiber officinale]
MVGHTISEAKAYEFDDLLEDVETPLFLGRTTYTKLSAVVILYNYKSTNGHTNTSFNELLTILVDMLSKNNTLPETVYAMRKLLKPFDLGYEKIHACPNDCCLFRKELKDLDSCPKCGSSRWKIDKVTTKVCKGVPEKVLRYFPVIPRLKRMFKSKEKAEELIWHSNHKSQDHMMRHPVDSVAWDTIEHKWPDFASDPRNLHLSLATDGFNPFGNLSSRYSCWPIILVKYNLPPLMCMTKENLMLTLLIPGPKQPGNDIDVYLQPLVEDLKELWDRGVEEYDAFSKSMFNLKAILMWTINDFSAYGNLAGCATKGKLACPICGEDICSMWLKFSRKFAYLGHRRFLAPNHPFRQKKKWFNGKKESKGKPRPLNGLEIFNALKDIENDWGKKKKGVTINTLRKKRKKHDSSKEEQKLVQQWKKKSFFSICHIGVLKKIKLPDGYNSNIGNCVSIEECKLIGLKSHDCHVLMQQLLSVALRNLLPKGPRNAIFLLGAFYNEFCQRVLDRNRLEQLEENIVEILCMLESKRARLCGPVQFRWIYPYERFMKTLKGYVKNRARPKGCIAECYLAEEQMIFCSAYIKKASSIGVLSRRNDDLDDGLFEGHPIFKGKEKILEDHVLQAAHQYVLFNTAKVEPYLQCDWANPRTGFKIKDGFTLVNLHQGLKTFKIDPFILASQEKQVFYSKDNDESNCYVLLKAPPRGLHNMNVLEEDAYTSSTPLDVSLIEINIIEKELYSRNDCEGIDVIET